jgi:hypothetical protein
MKLSKAVKQDIARKAAIATIAKKRDETYKALQKELTSIAQRQFVKYPLSEIKKYSDFILFYDHLHGGKDYPEGFREVEGQNRRQYEDFGFIPSCDIPLLKQFPCLADTWSIKVSDEYSKEYNKAVTKYMHIYFEAQKNYKLILESLNMISTDKELNEEFPELVIFFTLPDDDDQPTVSKEKLDKCKTLLKESRQLFLESI